MRNALPYFTHDNDARNHPKMKALRAQYGVAGYGLFWMLNEMISQAKNARLDLSKKITRAATAAELGMDLSQFESFLAFLSDPEYDLVNYENFILTTDRTQENYQRVETIRDSAKERYSHKNRPNQDSNAKIDDSNMKIPDSDAKTDTDYIRLDKSKSLAALSAAPVDNSQEPKSQEPEPDSQFLTFALKIASDRKARTPEAMARKLMTEPDVKAQYLASLAKPEPPPRIPLAEPEPPTCDCGGTVRVQRTTGEAVCIDCKRSWTWSPVWQEWTADVEELISNSG